MTVRRCSAVKSLSRPATARLAASRLTSHSKGPGQGFVEVVDVEDQAPFRGGERAEVRQVRVTAELDPQPRGRGRGQVGGHRQRRPPVVGERRDQHPAVPDRHQLGHPRLRLTQQQPHRVPVRRRVELAMRRPAVPGAGRLALRSPLRTGQLLHGHHLPPLSACSRDNCGDGPCAATEVAHVVHRGARRSAHRLHGDRVGPDRAHRLARRSGDGIPITPRRPTRPGRGGIFFYFHRSELRTGERHPGCGRKR